MYRLSTMKFCAVSFGLQGASASFVSLYPSISKVGTFWANKKENSFCSLPFTDSPVDSTRRSILQTLGTAATFSPFYANASPQTQRNLQNNNSDTADSQNTVRISIVGGGIAGITAASSLASRLQGKNVKIVVFEADGNANTAFQVNQPKWTAATARNANSIVPGVSMHIMSQRSTLKDILHDVSQDWMTKPFQYLQQLSSKFSSSNAVPLLNIDNFEVVPPYFDLKLWNCMGPRASSEERSTFLTFLRHFLATSLYSNRKEVDERAKQIVQLAKANRHALLDDFDTLRTDPHFNIGELGVGKGFVSLHRSKANAEHAAEEAKEWGEPAEVLSYEQLVKLEPHIKNLPVSPIFATYRPHDYTANCLVYVQRLKQRCRKKMGVEFKEEQGGVVKDIERINGAKETARSTGTFLKPSSVGLSHENEKGKPRFRITTADRQVYETDYLVLAAGVNTPLLARKVGAGHCCPTYPLRGFSLTLHTEDDPETESREKLVDSGRPHALLNHPMSIDSMYVSSVGPNMARLAGYGELVGYREGAKNIPSAGPRVLARYGRTIFPEATKVTEHTAIQCFRPMSPDDLPLAGKVSCVPGLFLHSGHGTMGWSLSVATAECVSQAVCDDMEGLSIVRTFVLPDKTEILRSAISPDRFA